MEESTSKEKVLKSVREALISKTDQPFPKLDYEKPVFREMDDSPDIIFAQELTAAGGMFIYCDSPEEMIDGLKFLMKERKWESVFALEPDIVRILQEWQIPVSFDPNLIMQAQIGMTGCEFLIARLGGVMVSTGQSTGRRIFIYPEVHIVMSFTSQLVGDLKDAIMKLKKKYESMMPGLVTLITGPSRTADIEKTLVMGAHGPKELYVFMIENSA